MLLFVKGDGPMQVLVPIWLMLVTVMITAGLCLWKGESFKRLGASAMTSKWEKERREQFQKEWDEHIRKRLDAIPTPDFKATVLRAFEEEGKWREPHVKVRQFLQGLDHVHLIMLMDGILEYSKRTGPANAGPVHP